MYIALVDLGLAPEGNPSALRTRRCATRATVARG